MIGTRHISGSDAINLKNFIIAFSLSIKPSSMLTSIICAPFLTCSIATDNASSYLFSFINLLNFKEPVIFVLSPILIKFVSLKIDKGSSPLSFVTGSTLGIFRGSFFSITFENSTI